MTRLTSMIHQSLPVQMFGYFSQKRGLEVKFIDKDGDFLSIKEDDIPLVETKLEIILASPKTYLQIYNKDAIEYDDEQH